MIKKPVTLLYFEFYKQWCRNWNLKSSDPNVLKLYLIMKGMM